MYRSIDHLTWVLMFQAIESDGAARSSPFFHHCSWTTKRMSDSLVSKPFISWRHLSTTILVSKTTSIRDWTCVWSTDISLCLAGRFCLVGYLDEVTLTTNPELRRKMLFALLVERYWRTAARGEIVNMVASSPSGGCGCSIICSIACWMFELVD